MLHQARLGIWQQQVICKTSDTILVSLGRMLTLDILKNNFPEQRAFSVCL